MYSILEYRFGQKQSETISIEDEEEEVAFILEWTTSLDTSSRTLIVCVSVCRSTSRRTSSYVIT